MKKTIFICLLASLLAVCAEEAAPAGTEAASGEPAESVSYTGELIPVVDNMAYRLSIPMFNDNGTTMITYDALAGLLGISEPQLTDEAVVFAGGESFKTGELKLSRTGGAEIDGKAAGTAVRVTENENGVFVPLRFVAEGFGCTVDFQPVFSDDNIFMGAYIVINTNKKSNVDWKVSVPEDLSPVIFNILDISKTLTGIIPEINKIPAGEYDDELKTASEQSVVFVVKDIEKAEKTGTAALDEYLESAAPGFSETLAADEELADKIKNKDGKIIYFPITVNDETMYFAVSEKVENKESAVNFLFGISELLKSFSSGAEQ